MTTIPLIFFLQNGRSKFSNCHIVVHLKIWGVKNRILDILRCNVSVEGVFWCAKSVSDDNLAPTLHIDPPPGEEGVPSLPKSRVIYRNLGVFGCKIHFWNNFSHISRPWFPVEGEWYQFCQKVVCYIKILVFLAVKAIFEIIFLLSLDPDPLREGGTKFVKKSCDISKSWCFCL